MAGNRNATPAQPTVGAGGTRGESRGGLFGGNQDPNINANAAQQVAIDTAEAEAAARAAEAAATASAMSAATATREAGQAMMSAEAAAASAAEAAREAMLAEDWVEGPNHTGYTYMRAVRDGMGNLLGTWTGQTTPGTVEQYLAADVMTRGNFMIDRETVTIAATDMPTDTNNSQYWVTQAANGAFEAAEAEVELLDAIARAGQINIDIDFLEALVAYTRALDVGRTADSPTDAQIQMLIANGIIASDRDIPVMDDLSTGAPAQGVIYSARAWGTWAARQAAAATTQAMAASDSANAAAASEAAAATSAAQAASSVNAAETAANEARTAEAGADQALVDARRAAGLDTDGSPDANPPADSAAGYRNQANTSATSATESALNAAIWAEGTDDQIDDRGGNHSSQRWSEISNYWAGFGVTVDAMGVITVNDGTLQGPNGVNDANAHSAAFWAEEARRHASSITDDQIIVTLVDTNGNTVAQNRMTEDLIFPDAYFNLTTNNTDSTLNLDSTAVFMQWSTGFDYLETPASFVTYAGALYRATMDSGPSHGGPVTPDSANNMHWEQLNTSATDLGPLTMRVEALETSLGNPMQTASATGSAYQRIAQNAADIETANRAIGDNTNNIATNTTAIAALDTRVTTNEGAISSLQGEDAQILTRLNLFDQSLTNIEADVLANRNDIVTLLDDFVDIIENQAATTVFRNSLVRVRGSNFNELYWRYGDQVSGVLFSVFHDANRNAITPDGYERLSNQTGSSGQNIVYDHSSTRLTQLREIDYNDRVAGGQGTSPQFQFRGVDGDGNELIDTVELVEVYTDPFNNNDPNVNVLDAIRIGDTIWRIEGGGPTPPMPGIPPITITSSADSGLNLYQNPANQTVTVTVTVPENYAFPEQMDIETNTTISGVTVNANSLTVVGPRMLTFTVTIDTQNTPVANHPFTVQINNIQEPNGSDGNSAVTNHSFRTVDGRTANAPEANPTTLRFPSTTPRADIITNMMPAITLTAPGMLDDGTGYDVVSFTRQGGTAENLTNRMGTYELVASDIPMPNGPAERIPFTFNFRATPMNAQPTETLTASSTVSVFNPWFLQAGDTATATLSGTPVISTDVIRAQTAHLDFDKAAGDNIFLMTTASVTEVMINPPGSTAGFPSGVTQRGTETVNGVSFNKYQLLNANQTRITGDFRVTPTQITT